MLTKLGALCFATITIVTATGCDLYWSDDGDDDVICLTPPALPYRNPETGVCEPYGGGGGGCGPCEPCPLGAPETGALPAWPACYGSCQGLDEFTCGATAGCHLATYDYGYDDGPMPVPPGTGSGGGMGDTPDGPYPSRYAECWDIAPLPVDSYSDCWNLDAYGCAMADHCVSNMFTSYDGAGGTKFGYCSPEQPTTWTCENVDCGFGYHCEEQCYPYDPADPMTGGGMGGCYPTCVPDGNSCAAVDCGPGYTCVERCDGGGGPTDPMDPTGGGGTTPPGYCYTECVEIVNEPGECYGDVWCDAIPPACPVGTTPGVLNGCYSGYCIPETNCGPADPGGCEPAICAVAPPSCPMGSIAGTKNGCYTGYCIPQSSCPALPCEALTDEMSCWARMECTAIYTGDDCTCTPTGCSCTSQTFDRCETWWF